jgi:hypothetical protein
MSRWRWLAVAPLFLLVGACLPSEFPLSNPATAEVDRSLPGTWERKDPRSKIVSRLTIDTVGKPSPEPPARGKLPPVMMRGTISNTEPGKKAMRGDTALFFLSDVNGMRFANLILSEEGTKMRYGLLRYSVDGKRLHIWGADTDLALRDLRKLGASVVERKARLYTEMGLAATTAVLRKHFTKENVKRWFPDSKRTTYMRVEKPK